MANIFAGSEVIKIAIQIEHNGRDFYNSTIDCSSNKKAKDIFKFLASEEEKHIDIFQKILKNTESFEQTDSYPGEYISYMNTLAREYIFTQKGKGCQVAQQAQNDKEAVNLGIGFEKDSIIFYEGIKKVTPSNHHKTIDELILQEQNHLKALSELKKELAK